MFLIRGAFWLGVAVMLLPTEERNQTKLMSTVVATTERVLTFCDRNPVLCQKSAEYGAIFLKKAEFGARMLMDVANERARITGESGQTAAHRDSTQKPAKLEPTSASVQHAAPSAAMPQIKVKTESVGKPARNPAATTDINELLRETATKPIGT
jgi:hypothetical protein